jgi:hypothetical protein
MKLPVGVRSAAGRLACCALSSVLLFVARTGVAHAAELDVPEAPSVTLAGQVTAADSGQPVADAEIVIVAFDRQSEAPHVCAMSHDDCLKHARSDARGRFEIAGVRSDRPVNLMVARAGYGTTIICRASPRDTALVVKLAPPRVADD